MSDTKVCAIIAAAGMSSRMTVTKSKQFFEFNGISAVEYSLKAFNECEDVTEIIIAAKEEDFEKFNKIISKYPKIKCLVKGGRERFESVKNAFVKISDDTEYVAIHDAARPLITSKTISAIIKCAKENVCVCPVTKVNDTVKLSREDLTVGKTLDRNTLFLANTPQVFKKDVYKEALEKADFSTAKFTDDASIVESAGYKVKLFVTDEPNLKITRDSDIELIDFYLKKKVEKSMRIGHGYDVHKLVENRKLILGGVEIPHTLGLLGHSDADVLTHAIMDSLLGAVGKQDIGKHFPDSDDKFKNISSLILLKKVKEVLDTCHAKITNIDATIIAQSPKLSPHIPQMRENIAKTLECETDLINIKATTEEGLGFTGEKLGIAAHSVCLVEISK